MRHHLSCGITQCYLPPDTSVNSPCLTPTRHAGTEFIYPRRMEGWVDLGGWLHTEMVYLSADSHPSNSNRARCRATALIETNVLTTTPCHKLFCVCCWQVFEWRCQTSRPSDRSKLRWFSRGGQWLASGYKHIGIIWRWCSATFQSCRRQPWQDDVQDGRIRYSNYSCLYCNLPISLKEDDFHMDQDPLWYFELARV